MSEHVPLPTGVVEHADPVPPTTWDGTATSDFTEADRAKGNAVLAANRDRIAAHGLTPGELPVPLRVDQAEVVAAVDEYLADEPDDEPDADDVEHTRLVAIATGAAPSLIAAVMTAATEYDLARVTVEDGWIYLEAVTA